MSKAKRRKQKRATRTVWYYAHKSSVSGEWVSPAFAKANPKITMRLRLSRQVFVRK